MDANGGCQALLDFALKQDMLKLHAMVWQQQASKAVVEALPEINDGHGCDGTAVQEALLQVLYSCVCQAAPPSMAYLARLIKQLIAAAEQQRHELTEPLLQLHTALLLQGGSRNSTNTAQSCAAWRYKTFYYSSQPSWEELQELQLNHCTHILAAAAPVSTQHAQADAADSWMSSGQQQTPLASWHLPVHLQQQLQQSQQAMQQLLAATELRCGQQLLWDQLGFDGQTAAIKQQPRSSTDNNKALPGVPLQQGSCQSLGSGRDSCDVSRAIMSNSTLGCSGLITIHSSDNMFEGGTGCHMWDAGFLLAEFVLNNPHLIAGKRILEVGCGPGLVATCVCRSNPARVLLTDGDPQALVNCLSNLCMNGHTNSTLLGSWREAQGFAMEQTCSNSSSNKQQHQVLACPLDWHEDVPGLSADVILASDCCYDPEAVPSLVRLLQQLLACSGTASLPGLAVGGCAAAAAPVAIICTAIRQDSTLQLFLDLCRDSGLSVDQVPKDPAAWMQSRRGAVAADSVGCEAAAAMFQELPALQQGKGREQYVLHRVTRIVTA